MRPQRRVMARRRMLKTGSIEFSETAIECTVRNVSEAGAALEVVSPLYIPDRFTLFIQSEQSRRTCRIVWRTGKRTGLPSVKAANRMETPDDPLMIPSPNCPQCGAVTSLVSSFLDGGSGRRVRMFRCKCGEEVHTPVTQPDTEH
jgi:hypothetical protein